MAVTSIGGHKCGQNLKIHNPIVTNVQQKSPQNRGGICCVFGFFSQFPSFMLLVSAHFLLFHDILDPQNSPPNEVTGIYIYIFISIHVHTHNTYTMCCLLPEHSGVRVFPRTCPACMCPSDSHISSRPCRVLFVKLLSDPSTQHS